MGKIAKGKKYQIEPSDGFLGIEDGEVQIIRLATYEDVRDEYADPEVLVDGDSSLVNAQWVVYKYLTGRDKGERYCLDEYTFEDHTKEK